MNGQAGFVQEILQHLYEDLLPTILTNIVNQATNYINGDDKYNMIITVNITYMVLLASFYLACLSASPAPPT